VKISRTCPLEVLKAKLVEALQDALPDCQAIYRFGSWGTEAQRPDSDIDLAVLPARPLDPVLRWELAQRLASLAGRDVDLVDLLQASTVLRMQVVASGERLTCADKPRVERFEDSVFSSYARFNEERREILADVRQRGSIHGK
jgi:predicted nucleotidyltransferase